MSDKLKIGLMGGSFNPPHDGHVHVARTALDRCGLDQVWWLVSPQNPLKETGETRPYEDRLAAVKALADHPCFRVSDIEEAIGSAYSADTLARLLNRTPHHRYCWVMGADNLLGFHHWRDWQDIMAALPLIVVDRPGASLAPLKAKAAQRFSRYRIDEADARLLPLLPGPAWTFLHAPLNPASSTALRMNQT